MYAQRERPVVRTGSSCARAVPLFALCLGHQPLYCIIPLNHGSAVAVAVTVTLYRQFPYTTIKLNQAPRGLMPSTVVVDTVDELRTKYPPARLPSESYPILVLPYPYLNNALS